MNSYRIRPGVVLAFAIIMAVFASCTRDFENEQREEQDKIQAYAAAHGFTEADKQPSGLYLKFHNPENNPDPLKPKLGQTVIVSFTGKDINDNVFESTDSIIAVENGIVHNLVYGPHRLLLGLQAVTGITEGLLNMSEGDSASMIIPSYLAYYDFQPLVYDVKMHKIIEDDTLFHQDLMAEFLSKHTMEFLDTGYYYVNHITNESVDTVVFGDTVIARIIGRYAEINQEEYYNISPGRQFFPLGDVSSEVKFVHGEYTYPLNNIGINRVMEEFMAQGDSSDFLIWSYSCYGLSALYEKTLNIAIVPPFMPIHYSVKIDTIIKANPAEE